LDVLNTFDNLIPGAYKADLFRYCYLFINGGFYVDINKTLEVTLDELIDYNYDYDFISVIDRYNDKDKQFGIYQAIIASSPNSELMKLCIERIVYNVKNNFYGINALHPTGPILLGSEFQKIYGFKTNQPGIYSNYNVFIKFLKNSENGNYTFDHHNKVITKTNQYVKTIQNKLWKKNTAKDHYSVMYSNRKIYRNQVIYEKSHLKYFLIFFLIFYLIAIMTFFAIYIRLRK
jgi:mannosyltransferase OCH1-like enzyme